MKKYIKYILFLLIMTTTIACDKVPNNGNLDGMWQLMSIEENGTVTSTKDRQVYWSIRTNLVQLSLYDGFRLFSHFERTGNDITLYDFCHESINEQASDNDAWIEKEEIEILTQWGIFPEEDTVRPGRLTQTFHFELLNSDNMILSSGKYKLIFRKF